MYVKMKPLYRSEQNGFVTIFCKNRLDVNEVVRKGKRSERLFIKKKVTFRRLLVLIFK